MLLTTYMRCFLHDDSLSFEDENRRGADLSGDQAERRGNEKYQFLVRHMLAILLPDLPPARVFEDHDQTWNRGAEDEGDGERGLLHADDTRHQPQHIPSERTEDVRHEPTEDGMMEIEVQEAGVKMGEVDRTFLDVADVEEAESGDEEQLEEAGDGWNLPTGAQFRLRENDVRIRLIQSGILIPLPYPAHLLCQLAGAGVLLLPLDHVTPGDRQEEQRQRSHVYFLFGVRVNVLLLELANNQADHSDHFKNESKDQEDDFPSLALHGTTPEVADDLGKNRKEEDDVHDPDYGIIFGLWEHLKNKHHHTGWFQKARSNTLQHAVRTYK